MQKGVSIIICTYNGAKRLPETLHHLAVQRVPQDLHWEVIVVDNNSSDNTSETVLGEWNKYASAPPLTILHQPMPGVTYAKEKGFKKAAYSYIIICDDDNWLAPDYIATVVRILDTNANIGIVGGWSTGSFETAPPVWFNKFATAYAIGQRRKESTPINWVATAGAGIRKDALDKLYQLTFEQILSGPQGKKRSGGEDVELCAAIRAIGYEVYFSTELHFVHFMSANRLTWQYFNRMIHNQSNTQSVFDMYTIVGTRLKQNKPIDFKNVYSALWADTSAEITKKCKTIKKALLFLKSLLYKKEGDINGHNNRYYINYLKYLVLQKREIKERHKTIVNFYERVQKGA